MKVPSSLLPGGSIQASTVYQPARESADFFVVGLIPYILLTVNNFSVRMGILILKQVGPKSLDRSLESLTMSR